MAVERNPNHGKFIPPDGFKDLGWQKHSGNCEEIKNACESGFETKQIFDNSLFKYRATDIIYAIEEAKIYWHVDMSD